LGKVLVLNRFSCCLEAMAALPVPDKFAGLSSGAPWRRDFSLQRFRVRSDPAKKSPPR